MKKIIYRLPILKNRKAVWLSLAFFITLFCTFLMKPHPSFAQQSERISLDLKNTSLETVLQKIEEQSGYHFVYNHSWINAKQLVSVKVQEALLAKVLSDIFTPRNISYAIREKQIILTPAEEDAAAIHERLGVRVISGTVKNTDGQPLSGATVFVKETNLRTATSGDGTFQLHVAKDNSKKTLVISYIGMSSQEVAVGEGSAYQVVLISRQRELDSVLVTTGYQSLPKERSTGSFATIEGKTLQTKLQPDLISRLEGQIPNVNTIVSTNVNRISIRGDVTMLAQLSPLIVVDGMPFTGSLQSINPAIIKNITFLKDAAAASIYGAQAANGVMVITTIAGSRDGKTSLSYTGTTTFTARPDMSKLQLLSSAELVDLQVYGFKYKSIAVNPRNPLNPVEDILLKRQKGEISAADYQSRIDYYKGLDNRGQLNDFYLQTGVSTQHNLAMSGGNEKNSYIATLNYLGSKGNNRYAATQQTGFTLRDNLRLYKWLDADLEAVGTFNKDNGDLGMGNISAFSQLYPSYFMLSDDAGNPLNIARNKSEYELQRLRSIGLRDESYSPVTNRQEERYSNASSYFRMQGALRFLLAEGLSWEVRYQQERSNAKNSTVYSSNSYLVRSHVNDAAQYNATTKTVTYNIPNGGQLKEMREDVYAYTLRTQLNFSRDFERHAINAIAGGERRLSRTTNTRIYYLGYDDQSLGYVPVNTQALANLRGTQSLNGSYQNNLNILDNNQIQNLEDRFISVYANAGYTYNNKYNITGSIRMDQSNLFGTDPKLQYKPLWSVGGSWLVDKEHFMHNVHWVDQLKLRLTYGIGGNVAKTSGPYLILTPSSFNPYNNSLHTEISQVPNPGLRWEKTTSTNLGLDFSLFKNRFSGTFEVYSRYTSDLLAFNPSDPTLGIKSVLINGGDMTNKGFEITLNGNIVNANFQWSPNVIFGYNKNNLVDVNFNNGTLRDQTDGYGNVKGYPLSGVFGFRYAGMTDKGRPQYYNATNEKVNSITSVDDVIFNGTTVPVYTAAFNNKLSYKNFGMSFMFIYKGGHVFRTQAPDFIQGSPTTNIYRGILNMWRQPGDELKENVSPGLSTGAVSSDDVHLWKASDRFVRDASFLKLRELIFSYDVNPRIIERYKMSSLSLNVQLRNLWTPWVANKEGIDPEAMGTYLNGWGQLQLPVPVSGSVGLIVNF